MHTKLILLLHPIILLLLYGTASYAQDATLPTEQDTWLNGFNPSAILGSKELVVISNRGPKVGLVQFDSSLQNSTDIESATLRVFVDSVEQSGSVNVHMVRSEWDEGSVSLSSAPTYDTIPISGFLVSQTDVGSVVSVDIAAAVDEWVSDPNSNHGLALTSTDAFVRFGSKEGGTPMAVDVVYGTILKPNVAYVAKTGGDYSDPLAAVADVDAWCDKDCILNIGPGEFELTASLVIPGWIKQVSGAGKEMTVLSSAPGVAATTVRIDYGYLFELSELTIKNQGGDGSSATAVLIDDGGTLRDVNVIAQDAAVAIGIDGEEPDLLDVAIMVEASNSATGFMFGDSLPKVTVRHLLVNASSPVTAIGISVVYAEESNITFDDFEIVVSGGQFATGFAIDSEFSFERVTNGRIIVRDAMVRSLGLSLHDYNHSFTGDNLRNDVIGAGGSASGVLAENSSGSHVSLHDVIIDVRGSLSNTGLEITDGDSWNGCAGRYLRVAISQITGADYGITATGNADTDCEVVTVDNSEVSGGAYSVIADSGWMVLIGGSKLDGPTDPNGGSIGCALVYDQDYSPQIDTCP